MSYPDSNQEKQDQNLLCYHYTIAQCPTEPPVLRVLNQKQAVAALYVISSILGLSAVMLTSSGAIKAMLFLMALAVAAFLASRVIFRRDIDKAMQAEKAAAEEKSTETATPAETVPAEPEEESNEEKKEEA